MDNNGTSIFNSTASYIFDNSKGVYNLLASSFKAVDDHINKVNEFVAPYIPEVAAQFAKDHATTINHSAGFAGSALAADGLFQLAQGTGFTKRQFTKIAIGGAIAALNIAAQQDGEKLYAVIYTLGAGLLTGLARTFATPTCQVFVLKK